MNKLGSKEKIFLVLDIGTSYIKCGCIDSENNIISQYQREFPMDQKESSFEIDFNLFFNTTNNLIYECLIEQIVKRSTVEALLITSQAQTFTAVDENFTPLQKGIVWLDERAEEEADYLKHNLTNFASTAGFIRPFPSLYVSKLLWLKRKKTDLYNKAKAFPLINEYLAYQLTGEFYSDSTSFGMSGMYDFSRNLINPELLSILGLTEEFFPKIEKVAMNGEVISKQMQQKWKLNYRFPIFLCGNDQGASACGAGLKEPGDVNINFGTAMVFYTITNSLITELTEDQIAGKHPVGDSFFLLNYESDFGIQIRQLKNKYFEHSSFDQLFQTYQQFPNVEEQKPFSEDVDLNFDSKNDGHQFCAGIIKYYLARLKTHFAEIKQVADLKNVFISGGMMQSEVWLNILQETLKIPITVSNRANAGLFGALDIYMKRKNRRIGND
ncbi:MAG: FGGY family carbohydrate kinase [Bacteroidota bacterium]